MSKQLPKPGTYKARRAGAMVVYESGSGALCLAVPYLLLNADIAFTGKHTQVMFKSDGTEMTKATANLRKIFPGWNSLAPMRLPDDGEETLTLEELPLPEDSAVAEFILADCYIDDTFIPKDSEDGKPIPQFKVQWMNALDDSGAPIVTAEEKSAIVSKWGAKFGAKPLTPQPAVAVAAEATAKKRGRPAKEAAPVEVAATVTPAAPVASAPPARKSTAAVARTSTADEVWNGLVKKHNGKPEGDISDMLYAAVDEVLGKAGCQIDEVQTPAQWGIIADKLGV